MEKSSDEPYVLGYALGTEANETNETGPLQMSYAGGPKHGYLAISCLRGFPISIEEGAEALSSIASRPGLFQAMNRAEFTPDCDNGDGESTQGELSKSSTLINMFDVFVSQEWRILRKLIDCFNNDDQWRVLADAGLREMPEVRHPLLLLHLVWWI